MTCQFLDYALNTFMKFQAKWISEKNMSVNDVIYVLMANIVFLFPPFIADVGYNNEKQ